MRLCYYDIFDSLELYEISLLFPFTGDSWGYWKGFSKVNGVACGLNALFGGDWLLFMFDGPV